MKAAKIMLCVVGFFMFVLGLAVLVFSSLTFTTLSFIVGGGLVVTGIFCLLSFFAQKDIFANPSWLLIQGLLDIFMGIFVLWNIGILMVGLPYIVAFWMLFGGIVKFSTAFSLKKSGFNKWWLLMINGTLAIIFSFLIMFFPFIGYSVIIVFFASYLIVGGALVFAEASMSKIAAK